MIAQSLLDLWYGFGVALATRGSSPFVAFAIPVTPLKPRPPAISGSK